MSQMRTIMVPPLELSVAVTSARPKIFITVQKTLDGLYVQYVLQYVGFLQLYVRTCTLQQNHRTACRQERAVSCLCTSN